MIQSRKLASVLMIGANVNKTHTADSINRIVEEMESMNLNPVLEEELSRAKQYILGSFVRSVETPRQISSLIYSIETNKLAPDYFDYFFSTLSAATTDDLFKVQKKYFNHENIVISLSGNSAFLKKQLKQFDGVSYYGSLDEMIIKQA
jgi:predicted Zn-dependent peptidase